MNVVVVVHVVSKIYFFLYDMMADDGMDFFPYVLDLWNSRRICLKWLYEGISLDEMTEWGICWSLSGILFFIHFYLERCWYQWNISCCFLKYKFIRHIFVVVWFLILKTYFIEEFIEVWTERTCFQLLCYVNIS